METLYLKKRAEWRAWLQKNAKSSPGIWLIYYKKASGKPRVAYEDAVEEALCFGWIDGKIKRLDDDRYAQSFTPRKAGSRWSALNIKRATKLIEEGRMTAAGRAAFNPERKVKSLPTEFPAELEKQFRAHTDAWENFQRFPPYYRRMTTGWVASAKKEETQSKRLRDLVEFSARNEKIKFM
jgi:uncharacterized protein YdeI (YjbR/CyaY-like superfamily)